MKSGPYTIEIFAHFDEGDPGGILFFPNYFRMSERAFELGLVKNGIEWAEWFDHPEWGVPLRHVEAEFHGPIKPGQQCKIRQGTSKVGDSSVTLRTEIHNAKGELCTVVHTTHVFVSRPEFKKRAIPDRLRAYLNSVAF